MSPPPCSGHSDFPQTALLHARLAKEGRTEGLRSEEAQAGKSGQRGRVSWYLQGEVISRDGVAWDLEADPKTFQLLTLGKLLTFSMLSFLVA